MSVGRCEIMIFPESFFFTNNTPLKVTPMSWNDDCFLFTSRHNLYSLYFQNHMAFKIKIDS